MLYKLENVKIDDNWKQVFIENKEAYDSESETNNVEYNEDDNEDIDEPITKKLVHGFTDAHTTYDLANKKINIAPAAG